MVRHTLTPDSKGRQSHSTHSLTFPSVPHYALVPEKVIGFVVLIDNTMKLLPYLHCTDTFALKLHIIFCIAAIIFRK